MNAGQDSDAAQPPIAATPGRRAAMPALAALAFVVAVGTAGAGVWYLSEVRPAQDAAMAARLEALERARGDAAARVVEATAGLAQDRERLAALAANLDAIERTQAGLADGVKALYARDQQDSLDWVLAEAEYLVLAASQRLSLERDVRTARAALAAADERLRAAEHPDLVALRERLAADLAALDAVAMPDIEGLALYLADAVARVEDLPTRPVADHDASLSRMPDETASAQNWRGVARALWNDLLSLVEVKDDELPDSVLFDPELRYFLQQNLKLELASARLAVLARDTENFRAAARLVGDLLARYYAADDAAVAALARWLDERRTLELDPEVPELGATLDAVRSARAAAVRS